MEYLIKNKKEFVITCGVFATFIVIIFWAIWAIIHGEFSTENVLSIVAAVIEGLAWYYNMPTSEENDRHTFLMRQEKAEKDPEYVGERFFDEEDDGDEEDENQKESVENEADDEE